MDTLRSRPIRRATGAVLLACYLVACHRWVPATEPLPTVVSGGNRAVRVTLSDSTRVELGKAHLVGDSLLGLRTVGSRTNWRVLSVAVADITSVEVAQTNATATLLAVVGVTAVVGLVVAGIAVSNWGGPYSGGVGRRASGALIPAVGRQRSPAPEIEPSPPRR